MITKVTIIDANKTSDITITKISINCELASSSILMSFVRTYPSIVFKFTSLYITFV